MKEMYIMRDILICLDGSAISKQAIPYALAIAHAFKAKITLLHVLEYSVNNIKTPVDPFLWALQKQEIEIYLDDIMSNFPANTNLVTSHIVEGKAAEEISHWIKKHPVDLVVLCSHGANGYSQWPLASNSQKLLFGSKVSTLLVPAKEHQYHQEQPLHCKKILVPLDGSVWAESVLPVALSIAKEQQAEILLAHVIPESGLTHIMPFNNDEIALENSIQRHNEQVAANYLEQVRKQLSSLTTLDISSILIPKHGVCDELLQVVAQDDIDMVIMNAHGRSARAGRYHGNIAMDFLANSKVPVLLVRGITPQDDLLRPGNTYQSELEGRYPQRAY
ncbi:MAG: nucleotide-binding universal stress UspA family protein [Congregibacter sp.]|jgi:nucleotide-binding universal stress UspA family protein